jgi:predicted TIM-barrel fold metal-dependent hydrolase
VLVVDVHTHFAPAGVLAAARRGHGFDGMTVRRDGDRVRPEAKGCARPPSAYLSRFWFDTVTHAPGPLRFLADTAGVDHVVYGTDYPFDMAAGALGEQLHGTGLSPADAELIAGRNAAALFGLGPPGPS